MIRVKDGRRRYASRTSGGIGFFSDDDDDDDDDHGPLTSAPQVDSPKWLATSSRRSFRVTLPNGRCQMSCEAKKKKERMLNNQKHEGKHRYSVSYLHTTLSSGIFIRFRSAKDDGGEGPLILGLQIYPMSKTQSKQEVVEQELLTSDTFQERQVDSRTQCQGPGWPSNCTWRPRLPWTTAYVKLVYRRTCAHGGDI